MRDYTWAVQSAHSSGVEAPSAIGEKYLRTLDALSRIDPVLSGWTIWEDRSTLNELLAWVEDGKPEPAPIRPVLIDDARVNMTALVEANVILNDSGEQQPDEGYTLIANNKYNQTPRNVSISVRAGSRFNQNDWGVRFGGTGRGAQDLSIITGSIIGGIFRAMTSLWPTPWAQVRGSTVEYEDRPAAVAGRELGFGRMSVETFRHDITWMGFLSADLARELEPPADLISERTADGGVLMFAAPERPDPNNADQMRRSDILGAIMDKYYPDRVAHSA